MEGLNVKGLQDERYWSGTVSEGQNKWLDLWKCMGVPKDRVRRDKETSENRIQARLRLWDMETQGSVKSENKDRFQEGRSELTGYGG